MKSGRLVRVAALALFPFAVGAQMMEHKHSPMTAAAPDTRELLKLAPETAAALRTDMQHMTAALSRVLELLAADKRAEAAKELEDGLGVTAMSTHPGMMKAANEMPESARMLGMGSHKAASELAAKLKGAKPADVYAGLQRVVAGCAACHAAYRVR